MQQQIVECQVLVKPLSMSHKHTHKTHTRTQHAHTHTHIGNCKNKKTQEEEEEMWSPSKAHLLANPMVPAGPHRLGEVVVGGVTLTAGLPGSASWLQLSSSSPPHGLLTHTTPRLCVLGTTQAALEGGLAGAGFTPGWQPSPRGAWTRALGVSP